MKKISMYDIFMFPLEVAMLKSIRAQLIKRAQGDVLELAFATGINMPYYDFNKIQSFHALDIHDNMTQFDNIKYHIGSAEALPFADNSIDTVILTLGLCTIPDYKQAIKEIHRVLKPSGTYIFLEHQQAKNPTLKRLFNKLNPFWKRHMGGCELIRESVSMIQVEPFIVTHSNRGVFHYGHAVKI